MTIPSLLTIRGVDNANLGLALTGLPEAFSAPPHEWPSHVIPGRAGVHRTTDLPVIGPRFITVDGIILADDYADANDKLDTLKALTSQVGCEIVFAHTNDRAFYGRRVSFVAQPWQSGTADGDVLVSMRFQCDDPYQVELSPTPQEGEADEALEIEVASGPTHYVARITGTTGGIVNPHLILKDYDGVTIADIACTLSLAENDYIEVDSLRQTIVKSVSSVVTAALDIVPAGTVIPPLLPAHADIPEEDWPTIETSDGDLTVTAPLRWE